MSNYTFKSCVQNDDQEEIIDLLYELKDDLYLPDRAVCQQITELCFANGGVIGGYDGDFLCAMMGYFYGTPECDYVNSEVAFMYVAGIHKPYRMTRVFLNGLIFSLQQFQKAGAVAIRLQAEARNPYTNKLYSRFACPTGRSKSLRGKDVITYSGSIKDALDYVQSGKRKCILPKRADEALTAVH